MAADVVVAGQVAALGGGGGAWGVGEGLHEAGVAGVRAAAVGHQEAVDPAAGDVDEMEARGPMKLSEVLDAQKAIIQLARALAKDGTIMMGGDDDYV